eukprot:6398556-Prymnesium_polylepis.1
MKGGTQDRKTNKPKRHRGADATDGGPMTDASGQTRGTHTPHAATRTPSTTTTAPSPTTTAGAAATTRSRSPTPMSCTSSHNHPRTSRSITASSMAASPITAANTMRCM